MKENIAEPYILAWLCTHRDTLECNFYHRVLTIPLARDCGVWDVPIVIESSFTMARLSGKLDELNDAIEVTCRVASEHSLDRSPELSLSDEAHKEAR